MNIDPALRMNRERRLKIVTLVHCNRSHPLKKRRQADDLYGIVVELADDLTDATRCT